MEKIQEMCLRIKNNSLTYDIWMFSYYDKIDFPSFKTPDDI